MLFNSQCIDSGINKKIMIANRELNENEKIMFLKTLGTSDKDPSIDLDCWFTYPCIVVGALPNTSFLL